MATHLSVGEALKLVNSFKGNKREVLAFISNVDTAFDVINTKKNRTYCRNLCLQELMVNQGLR